MAHFLRSDSFVSASLSDTVASLRTTISLTQTSWSQYLLCICLDVKDDYRNCMIAPLFVFLLLLPSVREMLAQNNEQQNFGGKSPPTQRHVKPKPGNPHSSCFPLFSLLYHSLLLLPIIRQPQSNLASPILNTLLLSARPLPLLVLTRSSLIS